MKINQVCLKRLKLQLTAMELVAEEEPVVAAASA